MKKSKKIVLTIVLILIFGLEFLKIFILPCGVLVVPQYLQDWFGEKTCELYTFQSISERMVGNQIVDDLYQVLVYTGDPDSAPDAGALNCHYYFIYYEDTVRVEAEVSLCKVCIRGEEGSVWLWYSIKRYDENDNLTNGSSHILTRCSIERDTNGEWIVTGLSEHP